MMGFGILRYFSVTFIVTKTLKVENFVGTQVTILTLGYVRFVHLYMDLPLQPFHQSQVRKTLKGLFHEESSRSFDISNGW